MTSPPTDKDLLEAWLDDAYLPPDNCACNIHENIRCVKCHLDLIQKARLAGVEEGREEQKEKDARIAEDHQCEEDDYRKCTTCPTIPALNIADAIRHQAEEPTEYKSARQLIKEHGFQEPTKEEQERNLRENGFPKSSWQIETDEPTEGTQPTNTSKEDQNV